MFLSILVVQLACRVGTSVRSEFDICFVLEKKCVLNAILPVGSFVRMDCSLTARFWAHKQKLDGAKVAYASVFRRAHVIACCSVGQNWRVRNPQDRTGHLPLRGI